MDQQDYTYQAFVKISKTEDSEAIELPAEKDGKLLLSTVQAQFPHAIGLKYRSSSGGWRGLRAEENVLDPPVEGWGDTTFYITLPDVSETLKRKANGELSDEASDAKSSKPWNNKLLRDIIVLGLPLTVTDDEMKEYFEKACGELAFHEIKYDRTTSKSRGFGFIRFKTEEAAKLALSGEHELNGKLLEVKETRKKEDSLKLFIGQLPSGTTEDSLRAYFSEFGELSDVYIPKPFRAFGFVTFVSKEDGRSVTRKSHMMDGARLNIRVSEPRDDKPRRDPYTNKVVPSLMQSPSAPTNYTWDGQGQDNRYKYNRNNQGPPAGKDMPAGLKNMLFQYLSNQR